LHASSDVDGAILRYMHLRLPEQAADEILQTFDTHEVYDRLADPALKDVVHEAVWFCWEHGRANYSPSAERRRFMESYVAGRIPTAKLLDEAWIACQAAEKDALRVGLLQQVREPEQAQSGAPDLDALQDDEIDRLYHGTLRKIAADSRKSIV